jgi:hypothetical protein
VPHFPAQSLAGVAVSACPRQQAGGCDDQPCDDRPDFIESKEHGEIGAGWAKFSRALNGVALVFGLFAIWFAAAFDAQERIQKLNGRQQSKRRRRFLAQFPPIVFLSVLISAY